MEVVKMLTYILVYSCHGNARILVHYNETKNKMVEYLYYDETNNNKNKKHRLPDSKYILTCFSCHDQIWSNTLMMKQKEKINAEMMN